MGSEGAEEGQDTRIEKPLGIGVQFLGPTTIFSGYIDLFFGPNINLEVGIGMLGAYGGAKYFFGGKEPEKRWFPYAGAMALFIPGLVGTDDTIGVYIPLGVQYMFPWGLMLGAELAAMANARGEVIPFGALRIAYRF